MADKKIEVVISAIDQTQQAFTNLQRALKNAEGQFSSLTGAGTSSSGSIADSWTKTASAFAAGGILQRSIESLAGKFRQLAVDATTYLGSIETATLGIASAFMTGGKYFDATTGKALQGQAAMNAAMADSRGIIEQLKVANMQTIATLDQLVKAYQETLPVALAKGFNREQVLQFTQAMVQAAGAIGLPFDQMGEETRSLLTGNINPRTSRIATVLGLRNEDLREMEGNSQALFTFLMDKLSAYQIAGVESQKTWDGLWSNWKDIQNQGLGMAFQSLFDVIKYELQQITNHIVTIDEATKTIKWNPEFVAFTTSIRSGVTAIVAEFYRFGMLVDKLGGTMTTLGYATSKFLEVWIRVFTLGQNGDGMKKLAEDMDRWNKNYQRRYEEKDRSLQTLANREVGLDKNGNPAAVTGSNWTANSAKGKVDKNAAKKANQDAIAAAELARGEVYGEIDLRREQNLEATKEWLRKKKVLYEQELVTEDEWIAHQQTAKEEEATIAAEAAREKQVALNAEWRAKREHYVEGKELDRAYLQYSQQFDKLDLDIMKATDAEKAALDDAAVAREKKRKKEEKEAAQEAKRVAKEESTALDLEKARQLAEIETREAQGAITATEAQREKLAVLQEIIRLEEERLEYLPRASAEEQIAWNQQAAKVENVKKQVADLQRVLRLRDGWEGAKQALTDYVESVNNLGAQIGNAVTGAFKGMEDALVKFVQTGKLSFRDLADSIIADIARILIQKTITGPLANAALSGLDSLFTTQAQGGVWQGGVQQYAGGGLVVRPTFFPMANGGMGLMGEAGPEAIMPLTRTASGHLGVRSSGNSLVVNAPITLGDGNKRMASDLRKEIEATVVRVMRRHS